MEVMTYGTVSSKYYNVMNGMVIDGEFKIGQHAKCNSIIFSEQVNLFGLNQRTDE